MSTGDYYCLLHPDRTAYCNPQGLCVCTECWELYRVERRLNLPLRERPLLQSLLDEAYGLRELREERQRELETDNRNRV